ncbi:MAG: DoxX family protein [Ginsengibacter sp.]
MESTQRFLAAKRISLLLFCSFYNIAGLNHFIHPSAYIPLIPPDFPVPRFINFMSGVLEMAGGIMMIIPATRKAAAWLIMLLLIAFIPAHIYMIQMNGCVSAQLCVPAWVAWLRLLPLQFILIWWAWKTFQWNSGK